MSISSSLTITYLGHSTALITTPGGTRFLLDPWTTTNPACPPEYAAPSSLGKIDGILVTHMHSDHAGDIKPIIEANPEAQVFAIFEAAMFIGSLGAAAIQPMNIGGTVHALGCDITMTHAEHSSSYTMASGEDIPFYYGGDPAGYVLKMEDGYTIYISGDTGLFGDMALIRELYSPTLAILPIGDRFTMGPLQAAHAVKLLGVTHVVPVHHSTFHLLTGTPHHLVQELANLGLHDVEVHALRPGETLG